MTQFPYSQYVQAVQAYRSHQATTGATLPLGSAAVSRALASAYAVLWLRPGAPLSVVKAAYRSLAEARGALASDYFPAYRLGEF